MCGLVYGIYLEKTKPIHLLENQYQTTLSEYILLI